ncbi:MAG: cupin domain-containing protein [Parvibaculaceae bacterium]|nr:cupin domain-containing protein [Parvibaculaceae bacterium]
MIDFQTFAHLASIDLGEPEPKPTSVEGEQYEAAVELWRSDDGLVEIGVWECTPGRFTAARETNSEICHIISGRVSLRGPEERTKEVLPGEMLVLPKGWRGEWIIHEKTRKLYILHHDAA